MVTTHKLYTVLFFLLSFAMVSQTIDIEDYEQLGKPQHTTSALKGPGPDTISVQNGNGTLGVIHTQSKCGLNYTTASQRIGQRFSPAGVAQPAPFAIGGIPAGSVIERAYLWAGGSGNGAAQTATINGPAGTFNYPMTIVGSGADVCWSYAGTYTYRADVTTAINGNGTYNISGLLVTGPTSGNDMSGATLMVIYSNSSASWAGNITIADGAIVIAGGNTNYNLPMTSVCGTPTNGRAFSIVDDLQSAGFVHTLNGTASGGTWNWWNYFDVGTTFTTGQTNSLMSMSQAGDCYAIMGYGTYYQNSNCISCSSLTVTTTPPVCGQCNGTASVAVSPPGSYTYTWSPSGGNAASATGLCAGNYTVAVQSGTLIQTRTFTLTSTSPTITAAVNQTSVSCFGACTGAATLTPAGGTAPYSYTWSPSGGNSASANSLCAGTYSVTIRDANTCSSTSTISITQPSLLTATTSQTNVLCNGGTTASASVTASGGTGAYSYTWAPSGGNAAGATGLAAGNYTVTIRDANNCSITRTLAITQPPALVSTPTQTNILCNGGSTGIANVSVSGGTTAYTYTWSPSGGNAASATGLTAGNYTVSIRDANNCSITNTFLITQPSSLTATTSQTNILCNGGTTGAASVSASGGTGAYTYTWSPTGGNSSNATGLTAGNYTIQVRDANNCLVSNTLSITQPSSLTATTSQTNVSCNGGSNGTASVSASGGTSAYSYTWSPSGGNSATATGLVAGTYTITIQDANLCTITRTLSITQPASLTAITSQTNVSCNTGSNGVASVSVSGGTSAYSYTWSPSGGNSATATGLNSGTYTVAISDANNCTRTATVSITQPSSYTITATSSSVSCFGQSTGSGSVTVSGATSPYTYTWSPSGGNSATASNLAAGNYTVSVRDANNCPATQTLSITQATSLTAVTSQTNISCNSGTNGSASISASGGTSAYSYTWSPTGGNASTATGLAAGNYSILVRDANGCQITRTITLTQPPVLTSSITQTNVPCFGQANGSASVTASGGTGSYTYTWAPSGGNSALAGGLTSGNYTVTINDANSCSRTQTLNITQPSSITAVTTQTNNTCGNTNGGASVSASGGTGAYTYTWSPSGGNAATSTTLATGNYTVTIRDANNCIQTASVSISQSAQFTVTTANTSVTCNGLSNGSASVTVSGTSSPYSYTWSPVGGNGPTATNLPAGNYTVAVRDVIGCVSNTIITITQPSGLTAVTSQTAVLCNGGNTGSASVTVSGGTAPYSYTWSPTGGNSSGATSLASGTYTVAVTDANACSITRTLTITQPAALTSVMTHTDVSCHGGNNGAANASIFGGITPYTYTWSPSGGNSATATGLSAGSYSVLVKDANACILNASVTIAEPTQFTVTASSSSVSCNGQSTGAGTVNVSGGTGPYSYTWSPAGGNNSTTTGLATGMYTITIKDVNNCTTTQTLTIDEPSPLTANTTQTNVGCFGQNTGIGSIVVSGGAPAYTYTWLPSGGNNSTANSLAAGNYSVIVNDANGCALTRTMTVTQPAALTAIPSQSNVLCTNGTTGAASVSISGGTGAYTYTWLPSGGNSSQASGLAAGIYTVQVLDANNCSLSQTYTITQPGSYTLSTTTSSILCHGGTGSASVSVTGGAGSYTYTWNPSGGNASNASGLVAGNYTVTITDANNCPATETLTITQPTSLTATMSHTNVSCNNGNNASAEVAINGGNLPYSYTWTPSGGNSSLASGLIAGSYTVSIMDANACALSSSVVITEPSQFTVTASTTSINCSGQSTGSATVSVSGATAPYTYTWSTSGGNTSVANGLAAGNYTVDIEDANQCQTTLSLSIIQPAALSAIMTHTDVSCNGASNGAAHVAANGGVGPYTYSWSPVPGSSATVSGISAGNYSVLVSDANACQLANTVTVGEATQYTITASTNSITCFGMANGSATITVSGGTLPYSYTWSPSGGNAPTASGLSAGTYSLLINDANLCGKIVTVNIAEPAQLTTVTSQTNSSCFGSDNASASVTATGGMGTYSYSWSPGGSSNSTVSSLSPGNYSITVSDANLCSVTKTLNVTQPSQYSLTASTNSVLCHGQSTGSATVNVSGNTPSYTYTWLPSGGNSASAGGLSAGSYTVNILDVNNCAATQTLNITEPTAIAGNISTSAANCGNADGSATVTVSGGQAPYTYTWSPTGGNAAISTGIPNGSYTCSILDVNNCPLSLSASVAVINPSLTLASSSYSICSGGSTSLFASGSSSYTWNPASSLSSPTGPTVTATPTITTTYSVTGANSFGCQVTNTITIQVFANPVPATSASSASICAGKTTTLNVSGASTYTWNPATSLNNANSSSPVATPINTQTYTVVATNSLGCTGTGSIVITVNPLPTVSATPSPTAICLHQTATLTANGASTYTWSTNATGTTLTVSPSGNTVYTITGRDANGCVNTGTVPVTVNQPPVVTISSVSSICRGQSATLNANGASTYSWSTSSTSSAITVTPSVSTSYTVIGTNASGCKDTSSYTVNVIVTPTLSVSGPSVVCSGNDITLTASGGNNGYVWNTSDVTQSITYNFTSGAVLTVSSGIAPCIGSASHTVVVNPLPAVAAIASPTNIIIGQSSQLNATGNGSYQWYPDQGLSCNTCANPVAQPSTSTEYTVEVTNANGCKNYATVLVSVDIVCGDLFAPSAFSPNNDGNNDTWTVYGNCIETIQCDIFNRWGQKVYSITRPGDAWDGTLNGVEQNSGVFIYQVNATFINGDAKSQKGNFTLVK